MKTLKILLVSLLMIQNFCNYADVAEGRYHNMGEGIKTEVYKLRQLFIPNVIDEITVKIKNRTNKPIMLSEDSFSGVPLISKEALKYKILNYIEYAAAIDKQVAVQQDAGATFLLKGGPFCLMLLLLSACAEDAMRRGYQASGKEVIIITMSLLASLFGPLMFFDSVTTSQKKVEKQLQDIKNLVENEFENDNLFFIPPVLIQPGEQKEVHIFAERTFTQRNSEWSNELWIDVYDASGKDVISRFSKIV